LLLSESLEANRLNPELLSDTKFDHLNQHYQNARRRIADLDVLTSAGANYAQGNGLMADAQAQLNAVEGEIRKVAGYADFCYWPAYLDVQKAIVNEVVVYIASASPGGMALIVGREQRGGIPGGHPNSPTCGRPKFLHPDRA
jgi:hypothetical protein